METLITTYKEALTDYDLDFLNGIKVRVKAGAAGSGFRVLFPNNETFECYGNTKVNGEASGTIPANNYYHIETNGEDGCILFSLDTLRRIWGLDANVTVDFYQLRNSSLVFIDNSAGFYGDIYYLVSGGGDLNVATNPGFTSENIYGSLEKFYEKLMSNGANGTYRFFAGTRCTLNGTRLSQNIWINIDSTNNNIKIYTDSSMTNQIAEYANGIWSYA